MRLRTERRPLKGIREARVISEANVRGRGGASGETEAQTENQRIEGDGDSWLGCD